MRGVINIAPIVYMPVSSSDVRVLKHTWYLIDERSFSIVLGDIVNISLILPNLIYVF